MPQRAAEEKSGNATYPVTREGALYTRTDTIKPDTAPLTTLKLFTMHHPRRAAPEDVRPYILDNVLPLISAGNDQRLPQSQLTRSPFSLIPWLFEQSGHAIFQLVKLLSIRS